MKSLGKAAVGAAFESAQVQRLQGLFAGSQRTAPTAAVTTGTADVVTSYFALSQLLYQKAPHAHILAKQERKIAGTLPAWQDMPLTWLANFRAGSDRPLKKGDIVMTGSLIRTNFPVASCRYHYELAGLGSVDVDVRF